MSVVKSNAFRQVVKPVGDIIWKARLQIKESFLRDHGLRKDDTLDEQKDEDFEEAMRRLPREVIYERYARQRRAHTLFMKKKVLEGPIRDAQTPFQNYVRDILDEVIAERRERAVVGEKAYWGREAKILDTPSYE